MYPIAQDPNKHVYMYTNTIVESFFTFRRHYSYSVLMDYQIYPENKCHLFY